MYLPIVACVLLALGFQAERTSARPTNVIRSATSGRWSNHETWEGGRVPAGGSTVKIRAGHQVTFDVETLAPIRAVHIAGTLSFDPNLDTRLDVGLIKIQAGDDVSETNLDCESHVPMVHATAIRPALEVGTIEKPIDSRQSAVIRLTMVDGLDPKECPAIICCGGRMDFHGAAMSRTWTKLGHIAAKGDMSVILAEPVTGWRVGDRVIVTTTRRQAVKETGVVPSVRDQSQTEERTIREIDGAKLTLDEALHFTHESVDDRRGEVANLSRNVVVESADPATSRGHTMYHRHSRGSISYAEFRHLGKPGQLGKYSLHFHRVGETMRGSSVVGASIWDSGNRWITIHGTDDLLVRDCVGYRSLGHGFFLEDGTEMNNILDRNLAVQACATAPLPGQVMGFDRNEGAGFWWANSGNSFTRNVAAECEEYGFRYDAQATSDFNPVLTLRSLKNSQPRDIRTIPFVRFEENEAHAQRRYGFNLGGGSGPEAEGGVAGIGPDSSHPFVIRGLRIWDSHWGLTPTAPGVALDDYKASFCDFGIWRPKYDRHAYRAVNYYRSRWTAFAETGVRPDPSVYPNPLTLIDDQPPSTVILTAVRSGNGKVIVRGIAIDNGTIRTVRINGKAAKLSGRYVTDWELELDEPKTGAMTFTAVSEDLAGNVESNPHQLILGN